MSRFAPLLLVAFAAGCGGGSNPTPAPSPSPSPTPHGAGVQPTPRYQFDTTDAVLRMVAAGFGWTIVTPLIFLKSMIPLKTVRVVALPGASLKRHIVVAMRKGESGAILQRIRAASVQSLREVVLPQIASVLPHCIDNFVIAGGSLDLAGRRGASRRTSGRRVNRAGSQLPE